MLIEPPVSAIYVLIPVVCIIVRLEKHPPELTVPEGSFIFFYRCVGSIPKVSTRYRYHFRYLKTIDPIGFAPSLGLFPLAPEK
jgi:hypothetical protein